MSEKNLRLAQGYYGAMGDKDIERMGSYLHPEVRFLGPLAKLDGKEAVLEGAAQFMTVFDSLQVRASFASDDRAMLAYYLEFPAPIGRFPVAALLSFRDDFISEIEVFFDARSLTS